MFGQKWFRFVSEVARLADMWSSRSLMIIFAITSIHPVLPQSLLQPRSRPPFPWVTAHSNCDYHQQPQTTKCSHSTHTLRRIPITSMLPPPPTLPLSKRNPISALSAQTHKLDRRGRPQMELCAITRKKGIGKSSCHCIVLIFTCSLKTI